MKRAELDQRLKLESLNEEGCLRLLTALLADAAESWREARRALRRNPGDRRAGRQLRREERFFLSEGFRRLTGLNGAAILERLAAMPLEDDAGGEVTASHGEA